MSLADRLKARNCKSELVEVDGEKFLLQGITRRERGELQAKCREKSSGRLDSHRLEGELLARCVYDPETEERVFQSHSGWDQVPAEITGPLISGLMQRNGFDNDELGKVSEGADSTAETQTPS